MTSLIFTSLIALPASAPAGGQPDLPQGGDAHGRTYRSTLGDEATRLRVTRRACVDHRRGLAFYVRRANDHRARMRLDRTLALSEGRPRSCPDARWLATGVWRPRARKWRTAAERWVAARVLRDFEVRPGNRAWLRAVDEAQKVFPGTASWLLSCSASEGGHGRWVPNSQGSGVGGWLQFYPSTFARMYGAASLELAARGFIVPGSAHSWYSPLGQALAGAWGVTNGRSHEWVGSGCRA